MKNLRIFEPGDKVKIVMEIAKAYIDQGDVRYTLKDPRRMGRELDYPFTEGELELIPEEQEGEA